MQRVIAGLALLLATAACGGIGHRAGPAPASVIYGHQVVAINQGGPGKALWLAVSSCTGAARQDGDHLIAPAAAALPRAMEEGRALSGAAAGYERDRAELVGREVQQQLAAADVTHPAFVIWPMVLFRDGRGGPADNGLVVAGPRDGHAPAAGAHPHPAGQRPGEVHRQLVQWRELRVDPARAGTVIGDPLPPLERANGYELHRDGDRTVFRKLPDPVWDAVLHPGGGPPRVVGRGSDPGALWDEAGRTMMDGEGQLSML